MNPFTQLRARFAPRHEFAGRPRRSGFRPRADRLETRSLLSVGYDPTFGNAGTVNLGYAVSQLRTASVTASDAVLQADGKLVVVGTVFQSTDTSTTRDMIAVRLNADGSLDTTFGAGGRAVVPIAPGGNRANSSGAGIAIQADGKVVIGGSVDYGGPTILVTNFSDIAVARLNTNGTLDTSFGGGTGYRLVDAGASDSFAGVAVAASGKIVVAGSTTLPTPSPVPANYVFTGRDFLVAQLNTDGSFDTGFDGDGKQTIDFGSTSTQSVEDNAAGLVVQADAKIVVAGTRTATDTTVMPATTTSDFAVARVNPDGSLDATFGSGGRQTVAFDLGGDKTDSLGGVALQADGKILLVGTANVQQAKFDAEDNPTQAEIDNLAVARLTTGGTLDTAFDGDGKVTIAYAVQGIPFRTSGSHIAGLAGGKILVSGSVNGGDFGLFNGLLAQLNADGSVDTAYGSNGLALLGTSADTFAVQPDGKVVLVDGRVSRTTAPEPKVVEALLAQVGKGKNARVGGVTVRFNTRLNQKLALKKGTYQIRLGTKGKNFLAIKRIGFDATTNTATLTLVRPLVLSKKQVLQVVLSAAGIVGADSQVLNGGDDLFVTATAPIAQS